MIAHENQLTACISTVTGKSTPLKHSLKWLSQRDNRILIYDPIGVPDRKITKDDLVVCPLTYKNLGWTHEKGFLIDILVNEN